MVIMNTETIHTNQSLYEKAASVLEQVMDPEIPVISVTDLGIVRKIEVSEKADRKQVTVTVTPTYTGCPALDRIRMDIYQALIKAGFDEVNINEVLTPAWTTDWLTPEDAEKLKAHGLALPTAVQPVCDLELFGKDEAIQCPRCPSYNTRLMIGFGSTPCTALFSCHDCKEPFDYYKCH